MDTTREQRARAAKAKLVETILNFRKAQMEGREPKTSQANPKNIAMLEETLRSLRAN